ncbi:SIR2 family protein, partial [Escherichia coli]
RGRGNIEDQIRSINELIKGLEILTAQNLPLPEPPPGALPYRNLKSELVELNNELTRCLKLFSDSVSNGEKLIRDAKNDLKTQTFNYLVSFLMSFSS